MQQRNYQKNDIIITYGDLGHEYFILDQGVVEILVYKDGTDPKDPDIAKKVAFSKFINTGIGFGEIALLYNDKRTATVRAAETCQCWVLEGKIFKNIIIKQNLQRKKNISPTFLDNIDIFKTLDRYDKLKLIDMLSTKVLKHGDYVFREGDIGDCFYMIEEGQVNCVKNTPSVGGALIFSNQPEEQLVRTLKTGEHFGELALLTPDGKRYLSVKVESEECVLLYLDKKDFHKIVGNFSKYLKMNYGGEFDSKFAGTAQARELARKQGRRGTVTGVGFVDKTKLHIIAGIDATIVEEKSGAGSSSNNQEYLSSIQELISVGSQNPLLSQARSKGGAEEDEENDYDF